jgi:hypothetical protein
MIRSLRRRSIFIVVALVAASLAGGPQTAAGEHADGAPPVIVAVGDLACRVQPERDQGAICRSDLVADLITRIDPDRFLALGDLQYEKGSLEDFLRVYDLQFGHLNDITAPAPGNHEYGTPDAQGYFDYFGAVAAPPDGYYSFDLGGWHLVSLNSDICGSEPGCGPGTPQHDWLRADLEASDADCTLAYWHHPRYDWRPWQKWVTEDDPTPNGGSEVRPLIPLWELLYGHGADVVLSGHNHVYHRWEPQDAHGDVVEGGIVQFTVGTGGRLLYSPGRPPFPENLAAFQNDAFGVLKMTLHPDSYDFEWLSAEGQPGYTDAGVNVACG